MSRARLSSGKRVSYVPTAAQVEQFGGAVGDRWPASVISAKGFIVDLHVDRPDGTSTGLRTTTQRIDYRSAKITAPALPPVQSAGAGGATVEMWISQDGSDSAKGSQSDPLLTVAEALRRAIGSAGRVEKRTTITLLPRTDGQRYVLPPIDLTDLQAPLEIVGDLVNGVNEVIPSTAAAAASTVAVVKSAGLVVDAFRGKTVEILSGAAAGDKRTIRNNTATDITPVTVFSAAVAPGDLYRVIEPTVECSVDLDGDTQVWVKDAAPNGSPLLTSSLYDVPMLYLINLNIDPVSTGTGKPWILVNSTVAMFGVELENVGFASQAIGSYDFSGAILMGMDSAGPTSEGYPVGQRAGVGLRFGALSDKSWVGWGLSDPTVGDFPTFREAVLQGFLVMDRLVAFGIRGFLFGGNLFSAGMRISDGSASGQVHLSVRGSENPDINFLITGTTWAVDASFFGATDPFRKLFFSQCTITATAGPAVFLSGPGYIRLTSNELVVDGSTDAVAVEMGGRIEVDTSGSFTAGTGDELAIKDGAGGNAAVSTVATLAARGAHIVHTDGSIIQRINT